MPTAKSRGLLFLGPAACGSRAPALNRMRLGRGNGAAPRQLGPGTRTRPPPCAGT
jgi:hypothetical protein